MIDRYFRDHPKSVGETYLQHFCAASGFAFAMIGAGAACLIHALIPGLFVQTGSAAIERLYDRLVINRPRAPMHLNTVKQVTISE